MPDVMQNREYLINDQYRTASNLEARVQIYDRFGSNPENWYHWLFSQISVPADARILELGSGPARLWMENVDRIPRGWKVTLSDLSPGMLAEARDNLANSGHSFAFRLVDAQDIPLADASLDAVFANHMLYHVPERDRALEEIKRVLRPGGRLFASTLSHDHLRELKDELHRLDPTIDFGSLPFHLDNGAAELSRYFEEVTLHRYEDHLEITAVEPLLEYIGSGRAKGILADEELRRRLITWASGAIEREGALRISTDSGVFDCRKADETACR